MRLLLSGATGFAGGEVLRQALADPSVNAVTVLTRRRLAIDHAKLKQVVVEDFLDYSGIDLYNHDACIWCLGVSQGSVDQDEYIRITHDYTVAAAKAMWAANPKLRFCFVSGRSADPSEQRASLFSRIKGRTERTLQQLGPGATWIFRPGYIRPTRRSGPQRDLARLFTPIGTVMAWSSDALAVDCDQLAACLLDVAGNGADEPLLLNATIRHWRALGGGPPAQGGGRRRGWALFKWAGISVFSLLGGVVAVFLISGWTALGAAPEGSRLVRAQQSGQWSHGSFQNPQPLWADAGGAWRRLLFGRSAMHVSPDAPVPVVRTDPAQLATPPASGLRVTWFGHSSALLEIDGSRVLVDPFWSERASPVGWAGPKRWFAAPIALDALPRIDAVIISHDHVDHLDYRTIAAMAGWDNVFVVPLGVGAHLAKWGIDEHRIVELDWWQSQRVGSLEIAATPARHGSGRLATKSNRTLWAGYALIGPQHRVWYSGDTGFHQDLERIGERYGPFDLTLIEAGQYDALWPDTHLGPELAVEAHRLVRGRIMLPVHWALISLGEHPWTEPAERVLAAARCQQVQVRLPRPGESIEPATAPPTVPWWPQVEWRSAEQDPVLATLDGTPEHRVAAPTCLAAAG